MAHAPSSPRQGPPTPEVKDPPYTGETPRVPGTDAQHRDQTEVRSDIGRYMDSEMIYCKRKEFESHYLPFNPTDDDINGCMEHLKDGWTASVMNPTGLKNVWADYTRVPSASWSTELAAFKPLKKIIRAIETYKLKGVYNEVKDRNLSEFRYREVNNTPLKADTFAKHKIDGCLTTEWDKKIILSETSIAVPMEFKLKQVDRLSNRIQLVGDVNHVMTEDPRRMFMYGITIEDDRFTVWYFSRSHSVKCASFSFVEDPSSMVVVLLSLLFATPEELGFDPNVTAIKVDESTSYVYAIPQPTGEPKYFLAKAALSEFRWLCVTGRTARIYNVVEVASPSDLKPLGRPRVLKDVWLDDTCKTETTIQREIFEDIETFALSPNWREDKCLKLFPEAAMEALGQMLTDGKYKKLFLTPEYEYEGKLCKAVYDGQGKAFPMPGMLIKKPNLDTAATASHTDTASQSAAGTKRTAGLQPLHPSPPVLPARVNPVTREYRQKRRCFFVYEEVSTALHHLPKLKEAMSVILQCLVALQLLFCAGWVHRDISSGNILAFRSDDDAPWEVKLSDLEYAKRFPGVDKRNSDPKTGTPFFMPLEVQSQQLLSSREEDEDEDPDMTRLPSDFTEEHTILIQSILTAVLIKHSFQHDLESIWWIVLWLITMRVDHAISRDYAKDIFQNVLVPSQDRHTALKRNISTPLSRILHQDLSNFVQPMESIRKFFISIYKKRVRVGEQMDKSSYGIAHAHMWNQLNKLKETADVWGETIVYVPRKAPAVVEIASDGSSGDDGSEDATPETPTRSHAKRPRRDEDEYVPESVAQVRTQPVITAQKKGRRVPVNAGRVSTRRVAVATTRVTRSGTAKAAAGSRSANSVPPTTATLPGGSSRSAKKARVV
ncbi:hypothetical protein FA15DRAFT_691960 [Coprinopsis marcescibilis]|uniref:Fungal-type protein kinase domain-containing protein n=1 Tax=Coprinopsis marcescibilis TaxID=230819 RepID=A0A5C3LIE4_COPMA|nr:hypothetical protein FA15DRAFT_691960 [Coprinopsis marcescibilis]